MIILSQLSSSLTYFYFIYEINIFNKLLLFAWHDKHFCAESAVKHQPTNHTRKPMTMSSKIHHSVSRIKVTYVYQTC